MQDAIYYVAMVMIGVAVVIYLVGTTQPDFLRKLLRHKLSVVRVSQFSAVLFVVAVTMTAIFEPAHIKQERLNRQNNTNTDQQSEQETAKNKQDSLPQDKLETQEALSPPQPAPAPSDLKSLPDTSNPKKVIKKNDRDRCFAPSHRQYDEQTKFTAYDSMQGCVSSGGREAKD